MSGRLGWLLLGVLAFAPALAFGHSKVAAIDADSSQLRAAFAGATPFVFSGPDPWEQLDEMPASMPDDAVAFLYTAGSDIRWVFVRVVDTDAGWSEDINYYFRKDGSVMKRERLLQSTAANISLEVTTYYVKGRVVKERAHHHALGRRKTDVSRFNDPDAPTFWNASELPFPEILDLWERLA